MLTPVNSVLTTIGSQFHWHDELDDHKYFYSRQFFNKEAAAYAYLLHYGVCASGVVPMCYGTHRFPKNWNSLYTPSDFPVNKIHHHPFRDFLKDEQPPKALILEFISNATHISPLNTNQSIIDRTTEAYRLMHKAWVKHGDIAPRNILLRNNEKPVIVRSVSRVAFNDSYH